MKTSVLFANNSGLVGFPGRIGSGLTAQAQNLDAIGVTLLRMVTTNVDGTGIRVAQPEALDSTNPPPAFEVNPANSSVQQPVSPIHVHQHQWHRQCFSKQLRCGIGTCGQRGREIFMAFRAAWPPMWRTWTITMRITSYRFHTMALNTPQRCTLPTSTIRRKSEFHFQ